MNVAIYMPAEVIHPAPGQYKHSDVAAVCIGPVIVTVGDLLSAHETADEYNGLLKSTMELSVRLERPANAGTRISR